MGALGRPRRARRPRGRAHPGALHEQQEGLGVHAGDAHVAGAGQHVRPVTVDHHGLDQAVDPVQEAVGQAVAQRGHPPAVLAERPGGELERSGQAYGAGHVDGARAPAAFLAATQQQRPHLRAVAHHQRADALGAAQLVARDRHQVGVRRGVGHVEPRGGLHGVGVERGARRVAVHDVAHLDQVGDGAHLVVGQHHRHHGGRAVRGRQPVELGGQQVQPDAAGGVDRHDRAIEGLDHVEHGVVLGRRAHRGPRPGRHPAGDGLVVGLGTARGEDHLAGRAAQHRGAAFAGLVEGADRGTGQPVRAGRVAVVELGERLHGRDDLGPHRSGGRMVQVDERRHGADGTNRAGPEPQRYREN